MAASADGPLRLGRCLDALRALRKSLGDSLRYEIVS